MKIGFKKYLWDISQDRKNLDFYLGFTRRGIPLPEEWKKEVERLAKLEAEKLSK